jgi:hypothetical protein
MDAATADEPVIFFEDDSEGVAFSGLFLLACNRLLDEFLGLILGVWSPIHIADNFGIRSVSVHILPIRFFKVS